MLVKKINNEDKEILEEVAKVLANRLKKMTISHL